MMENPFGITREEVLDLAAKKLADEYGETSDLHNSASAMIANRVKEVFESTIKQRVETFLIDEMAKIVSEEIVPVNLWGEREGKPTTIRATLAQRAKEFWSVKVNEDGRESGWGGTERSTVLMKQILKDEFAKAVKENADVIIGEFKKAITADATKLVTEHINKLINTSQR